MQKLKINKKNAVYYVLFLFAILRYLFPYYIKKVVESVYIVDLSFEILTVGLIILLFILNNKFPKPSIIIIAAIYLWFFITTLINGGNIYIAFIHGAQLVMLCVLMDIVTDNEDMIEPFLRVVRDVTLLFYIINFFVMILLPDGIPSISVGTSYPWYLYGNVNATIKYIMPGLCASLILDSRKKRIISVPSVIMIAGIIVTAFTVYFTATAVIGDLIVIAWVFGHKLFEKRKWKLYAAAFLMVFVFETVVVFGTRGSGVLPYITAIFHKDATFSGRTPLWVRTCSEFVQKPVSGYGYRSYDELFSAVGNGYGCHNYYLDIMYQRGIIGLVLILALFITPIVCCWKKKVESRSVYILIGICIAYAVMFLAEPFYDYEFLFIPIFYVLYSLSFKNKSRALIPKHILERLRSRSN